MNILLANMVIIALILFAAFFLIFIFSVTIFGHIFGAPFVRSDKKRIATMLECAAIKSGEIVYDLGSGDGSLVIEAARRGAHAIGIEINPFLTWYSRWRIRKNNFSGKVRIIAKDFRNIDLHDANIIFLYLWPETIVKLKEKLTRELTPGTRIISNAFAISGWIPILVRDGIYVYEIKSETRNPKSETNSNVQNPKFKNVFRT